MLDDLRHAFRALRRAPGFTCVAVLTIALAIGANTAIFSIADAVLFRPLPFRDPASLFVVQMLDPATARRYTMVRWSHIRAIRDNHRGVGDVATIESGPTLVASTPAGPEYVRTAAVTANYFEIFGAAPARGRLFGRGDAPDGRTALLSYEAWQSRFGGDEAIVGGTATFGAERFDVVGILPRGFLFPTPLVRKPEVIVVHDTWDEGPGSGAWFPIVRLEPSTTREQADAELATLAAATRAIEPAVGPGVPVLQDVRTVLFPAGRPIMRFLLTAAVLVLLIGCANLANLFLARAQRQQRDLGVRVALGASRLRILRPLVLEAVLIGTAGAALALAVTSLSFDMLIRQVPPIAYGSAPVGVDLRVGAFALALGGLGAGLFAMLAAWRVSRLDLIAIIQRRLAGRPSIARRFGQPMVAVQVAIAVVLVFGAAITGRALFAILQVPLGFDAERVIAISAVQGPGNAGGPRAFYGAMLDRLRGHADVISAGAAHALPLSGAASYGSIPGTDGKRAVGIDLVMPGYFDTIGARLERGRLHHAGDLRDATDVIVLSRSAARVLLPGLEPIGASVRSASGRQFSVIGVVSDIRGRLDGPDIPAAYALPFAERALLTVVVRVRDRNGTILPALRRDAAAVAGGQPVDAVWWDDTIDEVTAYRNPRFQAVVLVSFAALALALTATGVFGLISFLVANRAGELGVRASLGATPPVLVRLVFRQALTPVIVGLAAGLVASRGLARLAEAQLYQVNTNDPLTLVATATVVVLAACLAAYAPARRARHAIALLRAEG